MAKHTNVYDAMLAGFVKLILVIAIGALTLSKFAGFEWWVESAALTAAAARRASRRALPHPCTTCAELALRAPQAEDSAAPSRAADDGV
jgi:hypothetical protein